MKNPKPKPPEKSPNHNVYDQGKSSSKNMTFTDFSIYNNSSNYGKSKASSKKRNVLNASALVATSDKDFLNATAPINLNQFNHL